MSDKIYFDGFSEKADIEKEFDIKLDDSINILFAEYWYGNYEGSAFILFTQNNKLFEVNGGHCSCNGLENQWEPEPTNFSAIKHYLEKGTKFDGWEGKEVLEKIVSEFIENQDNLLFSKPTGASLCLITIF